MATPKNRVLRVHDAPWEASKARAAREGRTLADVVAEFLETYGGVESERRAPRRIVPTVDA